MKDLKTFEELVTNNSFRNWVLSNRVVDNDHWVEKIKTEEEAIEEATQFVQGFQFKPKSVPALDIDAAWENLDEQISQPRSITRRVWLRAAAAAILLIATASTFWLTTRKSKTIVQSTEYGKQLDINLPDNSLAQLNANSALTFKETWKISKKRAVELKGQAFFNVETTKDKATFTVQTKEFDVEVLGTQFDVIARDDHSSVAVKEGTVRVKLPKNSIVVTLDNMTQRLARVILNAGEKLTFRKGKYWISKLKPSNVEAHKIVHQEPSDFINTFKDIYGYELVFQDKSMLEKKMNTILLDTESNLSSNIELLTGSLGYTYEIKDKRIIISK